MRELVYYVAVSLDGFIAGPGGEFDAFAAEGDHMDVVMGEFADVLPTHVAQHCGIAQERTRFASVVMGARTYQVGLPDVVSPYRHLEQVVFSRHDLAGPPEVRVSAEDPVGVVRAMKAEAGADIWLCGGGTLAGQLIEEIDLLVLKRSPIVLGDGIPLFRGAEFGARTFELVRSRAFDSGVVISEHRRTAGAR